MLEKNLEAIDNEALKRRLQRVLQLKVSTVFLTV